MVLRPIFAVEGDTRSGEFTMGWNEEDSCDGRSTQVASVRGASRES